MVLSDPSDKDWVRLRREGRSKMGPLSLPMCSSSGAEPMLMVRFERLLDVERKEGVRLDLALLEDRRSGTTTTGMLPLFHTSRLARPLVMDVTVELEA